MDGVCAGVRAGWEYGDGRVEIVSIFLLHLEYVVLDTDRVPADRPHRRGIIERLDLKFGLESVEMLLLEHRDCLEHCAEDGVVFMNPIVVLNGRVFVEATDLPVLWEGQHALEADHVIASSVWKGKLGRLVLTALVRWTRRL